jgi:hypothetical protein
LKDEEQTDKAMLELDWKEIWGGSVGVKTANSTTMDVRKEAKGWRLGGRD